jgi:hypothetical protein
MERIEIEGMSWVVVVDGKRGWATVEQVMRRRYAAAFALRCKLHGQGVNAASFALHCADGHVGAYELGMTGAL